jgi:hypothetical protein
MQISNNNSVSLLWWRSQSISSKTSTYTGNWISRFGITQMQSSWNYTYTLKKRKHVGNPCKIGKKLEAIPSNLLSENTFHRLVFNSYTQETDLEGVASRVRGGRWLPAPIPLLGMVAPIPPVRGAASFQWTEPQRIRSRVRWRQGSRRWGDGVRPGCGEWIGECSGYAG